jgi:hypothetical protein
MQRGAKSRSSQLQLAKLNFQKEMKRQSEVRLQKVGLLWRAQLTSVAETKSEIDSRYDSIIARLESIFGTVSVKLATTKQECITLRENIDCQKSVKTRLQDRTEANHLEISAEIDLELKLQQHAAELQVHLGDARRRLDRQLEKKARLKKSYIRAINHYKKLKLEDEDRSNRERALQRKAFLLKRKKELEEEQQKAREEQNDPRNKYRALLAAAGHIDPLYQKPTESLTFYQGPLIQTEAAPTPDQIVVDSPQYDEGIWLENNIRTLLSTGNYADDDPVIRSLRSQLYKIRH